MNIRPRRSLVEKGSHALLGNVLNVDDRNALSVRLPDSPFDVLKNDLRVS